MKTAMSEKSNQESLAEIVETLNKFAAPKSTNGTPTYNTQNRKPGYMLAYFAPGFVELSRGLARLIEEQGTGNNEDLSIRGIWKKIGETLSVIADAWNAIVAIWQEP